MHKRSGHLVYSDLRSIWDGVELIEDSVGLISVSMRSSLATLTLIYIEADVCQSSMRPRMLANGRRLESAVVK